MIDRVGNFLSWSAVQLSRARTDWVSYYGPREGKGWKSGLTGRVIYRETRPGTEEHHGPTDEPSEPMQRDMFAEPEADEPDVSEPTPKGGTTRPIVLPDPVKKMLDNGAALVLSVSGGKDSDAMTWAMLDEHRRRGWTGPVRLVHADLGRAEWATTPAYVESLSARTGVPLTVVRHSFGDLIDGIRRRMKTRPEVPPWPSSAARWCTSDWKRGPISRYIRNEFLTGQVVCAMGMRAEESIARGKRPVWEPRSDCCKHVGGVREVVNWSPLHDWELDDVWNAIETHGDGAHHPAYDKGNERLSCACCVLASMNDLLNGAKEHPDLYRTLCEIEADSGFSFRANLWLSDLRPDLLQPATLARVAEHKVRQAASGKKSRRKSLPISDTPPCCGMGDHE